jgi:YD repeat-containing protein
MNNLCSNRSSTVLKTLGIIAIWALSLTSFRAGAQQGGGVSQDYLSRLTGAAGTLVVNGTVSLAYQSAGETGLEIKNIVTLSLNEESSTFLPAGFSDTVTVKIDYGSSPTSTSTLTQNLIVTYNPLGGMSYNPRNYLNFTGAQFVRLTVLAIKPSVTTLSNGVNPNSLLALQDEMLVWRTFTLSSTAGALTPTLQMTPPPSSPVPDGLPVSWSLPAADTPGNTGYQLEWTWLESELAANYVQNGALSYNLLFQNNFTRVDLPLNIASYTIPLFYDGIGKLYFRVRAVNYSASGSGTFGPYSAIDSFAFNGHNNNMNWQVQSAYAEQGKRKTVMNYYDGTLRQRQSVAKDNTTNTTVTAETFYDGQGRVAIQVLPAPGINSIVAYTQNLNLFNGQAANTDPAALFDLQPISMTVDTTPAMQADTGAALYYSPSNHELAAGNNQAIPNAAGYPYSLVRYTPDNTNRVLAQTGLGTALRLGSGHEQRYFYGNATQEELDGLFGTEAGDYTHYFKNMVLDANGQAAITYVDMHGRTVAAALAGGAPDSIRSLNMSQYPGQAGTVETHNLLNGNANNIRDNSIEALTTILVPVTGTYTFNYALTPQSLGLTACGNSVCYGCMYNLDISITDESALNPPILRKFDNVSLTAGNSCSAGVTPFEDDHYQGTVSTVSNNTISFTQRLAPGSYSIRKTLTVSQAALQTFQAQYAKLDQCGDSLMGIIDSVYAALLPTSNCHSTSTLTPCQACMNTLGTYAAFKASYLMNLGDSLLPSDSAIHAIYTADSATCTGLATTSNAHGLAIIQAEMLADMMPYSGQYAQNPALVSQGTMYGKYNIFSATGGLTAQPYYDHPLTASGSAGYYLDAAGNIDLTIQPTGTMQLLSPLTSGQFETLFSPSWAQALLPHHPEYPQLQFALQNLVPSYDWISNFNGVTSFDTAMLHNFTTSSGNSETVDSFFLLTGTSTLKSTMTNYETVGGYYGNLSLWQIAYGNVMCSTIANPANQLTCYRSASPHPPYSSLTIPQMNEVWSTFQGLYTSLRDSMVNAYINAQKPDADANTLVGQGYILRFPTTTSQLVTQYTWTGFPTTAGAAPNVNMPDSVIYIDTSRCGSYVATWAAVFSQCPALLGASDSALVISQLTAGMKTVCEKGQDAAHPYGSSTVAPSTPQDGTPRSFSDVVNQVFTANGLTVGQFCNPFEITFPKPYAANPVIIPEYTSQLDTCACNQFATLSQAASTAGYNPSSLSSLNRYLDSVYQDTLTQVLFTGLQQCSLLGTAVVIDSVPVTYLCINGSPCPSQEFVVAKVGVKPLEISCDTCHCNTTCPIYDTIEYIPLGIAVHRPPFLDCGFIRDTPCVTCARLSALITSYKSYFTGQACDSAPMLGTTNLTPAEISYNVTFAQYVNAQTGLQLNWTDYVSAATATSCNLANYLSNGGATQSVICANPNPLTDTAGVLQVDTACQQVMNMAIAIGQSIYAQRQAQVLNTFASSYMAKCLATAPAETFTVTDTSSEYHYTLYYYDLAGNLQKTVPPAGARPNFSTSFTNQVDTARSNGHGTVIVPSHLLVTNYRYNSLNLPIVQQTPDAGISHFYYDTVGRLAVSQNALQASTGNYSFTLYDALERITEVAQKPQSTPMTQQTSQSPTLLNSWLNGSGGTINQITGTVYDVAAGFVTPSMMTQQNLRNRVSYMYFQNFATDAGWYTATLYDYDVHGNVDTLLQDYVGVNAMSGINQYKRMCYNYDLVSGKVNGVDYQPGASDAFYHRYFYDAQNRITQTLSSRDSLTWEQDASYDYYKHGSVSRVIVGQLQAQQVDYSYTLQGWQKGVNIGGPFNGVMDSVTAAHDTATSLANVVTDSTGEACPAGTALANAFVSSRPATGGPALYTATSSITFEPGFATGTSDQMTASINPALASCWLNTSPEYTTGPDGLPVIPQSYPIAQDGFSYSLHYYPGDYIPIGSTPVTDVLALNPTAASPMFNGNIAAMAMNNPAVGGNVPLVYNYHYDQLNRLVQMDAFKGWSPVNNTFTPAQVPDYQERVSYDPNGNIGTYIRHGYGTNIPMDSLTYNYYSSSNQLAQIIDGAGGAYTTDLKTQPSSTNYSYDPSGELTQDLANGVTHVDWTPFGKVADLTNASGTITFTYDAAGNRISKSTGSGAGSDTTIYVRDPQGNVMTIYQKVGTGVLQPIETDLYGNERIGSVGPLTVFPSTVALTGGFGNATLSTFTRGEKSYELINHLGNVLMTVTDKKIAVVSGSNNALIDHFTADVATAQDYYPFGMLMPGRTFTATTATNYRYGFNGQERVDEVEGSGNSLTAAFWEYDPRAGRRWNVEPEIKKYPWASPYSCFSNSPIQNKDPDGKDPITAIFEGLTAFGIEAGLDFLTQLLVEGKGAQDAFDHVNWKGAAWEGVKATAFSFFLPTGSETAVRLAKIGKSRIGKLVVSYVKNITNDAYKNYLHGDYDKDGSFSFDVLKDKFGELAIGAGIETLLDAGLGSKAEELFKKLEKSNANLARQYASLFKALDKPGITQKIVDNRVKQVNQAAKTLGKNALRAAGRKGFDESTKKAAVELEKALEKAAKKRQTLSGQKLD